MGAERRPDHPDAGEASWAARAVLAERGPLLVGGDGDELGCHLPPSDDGGGWWVGAAVPLDPPYQSASWRLRSCADVCGASLADPRNSLHYLGLLWNVGLDGERPLLTAEGEQSESCGPLTLARDREAEVTEFDGVQV
ncbi:hypothetical protein NDU88_000949 [Pleurodeles waltl]|uniref:Uncharacterized protein n=1 Tax=Pleurodeles waltl TaxID=8319 RepID=A0AAV7TGG7_PLEWA|nr:hypothetical protein NDU88_000949 [Pleurodeles waltl]